jgi:hypothetical protein
MRSNASRLWLRDSYLVLQSKPSAAEKAASTRFPLSIQSQIPNPSFSSPRPSPQSGVPAASRAGGFAPVITDVHRRGLNPFTNASSCWPVSSGKRPARATSGLPRLAMGYPKRSAGWFLLVAPMKLWQEQGMSWRNCRRSTENHHHETNHVNPRGLPEWRLEVPLTIFYLYPYYEVI